jgi:hypothetical protein
MSTHDNDIRNHRLVTVQHLRLQLSRAVRRQEDGRAAGIRRQLHEWERTLTPADHRLLGDW